MTDETQESIDYVEMLNKLSAHPVMRDELSTNVLEHLIGKAMAGQTVTYLELAEAFDMPTTGNQLSTTISVILIRIHLWCVERGMPPITSLVVRKSGHDEGLPGKGFWKLMGFEVINTSENRDARRLWTNTYHQQVFNFWSLGQRPLNLRPLLDGAIEGSLAANQARTTFRRFIKT